MNIYTVLWWVMMGLLVIGTFVAYRWARIDATHIRRMEEALDESE